MPSNETLPAEIAAQLESFEAGLEFAGREYLAPEARNLVEATYAAGIAEGRRQASAAVLAIVEQQLDRLDAVAYTVDIRDMRGSSRPVIASVVDRNAAMHMLLFVREALRREQGITQGADQ